MTAAVVSMGVSHATCSFHSIPKVCQPLTAWFASSHTRTTCAMAEIFNSKMSLFNPVAVSRFSRRVRRSAIAPQASRAEKLIRCSFLGVEVPKISIPFY